MGGPDAGNGCKWVIKWRAARTDTRSTLSASVAGRCRSEACPGLEGTDGPRDRAKLALPARGRSLNSSSPACRYTWRMQHLRAATKGILKRVEEQTSKSIQFMRDEKLSLLATLQMARNGADFHVLRYRPSDEPLDYLVAFQAGFVLRLFQNEPGQRFDFAPSPTAGQYVEPLLAAGQTLGATDKKALPEFAKFVAQWALMNLRSLPIGMRIDRWIATEYPELKELQLTSIGLQFFRFLITNIPG